MKRWKKVVIWVASIVVVLGIGGLFAANYAVDKVLNSMIGMSVDDLLDEPGEKSSSEDAISSESTNEPTSEATQEGASNEEPVEEPLEEDTASAGEQENNSNGSSTSSGNDKSTDSGKSDSGYSAAISTDKAKEVEENITVADKAKVVTTLLGALSASDISTLQSLAGGGLSIEDKKEAKALLLEKLTEDQYNDLIAIAAKHGLSQGKTYSENKK